MTFWPRERIPYLPTVASSMPFQPIAPHFNNPAWELPQAMVTNHPYYNSGMNLSGPWAQTETSVPKNDTEDKNKATRWSNDQNSEKERRDTKEGKSSYYDNESLNRRSDYRERSRERDDRAKDRERRRRSRDRRSRSSERSDDSPRDRKRRDASRERRDGYRRNWEDDKDVDRRRERSPLERKDDEKSRFSSKTRSRSRSPKSEETSTRKTKHGDGDGKYSLESANYKTQTPNETIMIRGLAQHISENDIRHDILECGLLPKDIRLIRKKETGVSRGFAFVEFNSSEEALSWMERKQGVLMLKDKYRAIMQFSIVAGDMGNSNWQPSADWDCPKCNAYNFKKRMTCYKCMAPRPDSSESSQAGNEISPHPTTKLMIRFLDPLTNEENLLKEISGVSDIPIQSCHISRESPTNLSRGVCYLEMKNVLEAIKLYNQLTAKPLIIQGKQMSISYCKLQPDKAAQSAWLGDQVQRQYSMADVPRLAEYSARMYASNPAQKAAFLQYYTQYYTNQIQQMTQIESATDTNSAAAVAQSAIQLAQTKKAVLAGAAASALSAAAALNPQTSAAMRPIYPISSQQIIGNTSIGEPDVSSYVYDESSGYYFDSKTGLYFDATSQYYYHSQDQVYLYWDPEKKTYMAVNGDNKTKMEEGKDDKKKDKDKQQDKVKVAKRIAKDMERWAKTLNQKKEVARMNQVAVQQAQSAAKSAATADVAFAVLERQETTQQDTTPLQADSEGALVASYGGGSDSDEANEEPSAEDQFHTDWTKMACLLCKRQFPNKDALQRHQQLSYLHKQNLEAWYRSRGLEPPAQRPPNSTATGYRDRAKERRLKFGVPDNPKPNKLKEKFQKVQDVPTYDEPNRAGIPSGNLGSKMLQKMGWSEGMGLGKMNQGRTDIVEAVQRVSSAGLGVAGSSLGPAGAGSTYKDNVKRAAIARFAELKDS